MASPTRSLIIVSSVNKTYFEPHDFALLNMFQPSWNLWNAQVRQVLTDCTAHKSLKRAGLEIMWAGGPGVSFCNKLPYRIPRFCRLSPCLRFFFPSSPPLPIQQQHHGISDLHFWTQVFSNKVHKVTLSYDAVPFFLWSSGTFYVVVCLPQKTISLLKRGNIRLHESDILAYDNAQYPLLHTKTKPKTVLKSISEFRMPWISVPFGVSDPKHSCIFPSFDMPPIC
jgi:hypothetical protein